MANTFKSYREQSKTNWGRNYGDGDCPTNAELQTGAILRMADAAEKMAQNHEQLIRDKEWYQSAYNRQVARCNKLERSNAALRGHIKRLKKK